MYVIPKEKYILLKVRLCVSVYVHAVCVCVCVSAGVNQGRGRRGTGPPGFAVAPLGFYLFDIQCCWYDYIVMGDTHF